MCESGGAKQTVQVVGNNQEGTETETSPVTRRTNLKRDKSRNAGKNIRNDMEYSRADGNGRGRNGVFCQREF